MRNNLSRNFIIGLSFLVALVLLYFGVNFLKGINILKKKNTYAVVFEDVTGLHISAPIFLSGFQIGLVNDIKMLSVNPIKFVVDVNLEGSYRIPKGSYFEFGSDLLGASAVNLIVNVNTSESYSLSDTLQGRRERDMMSSVTKILPRADSLLTHLDSLAISINRIVNSKVLENTFRNIDETVAQLNKSGEKLNIAMTTLNSDLPEITTNVTQITNDLKDITYDLSLLDIDKMYKSIELTLDNIQTISTKLNSGDNSLGRLTSDTQMHDSLTSALNSISELLEQIRLNPEKYLSVKVRLF